MAALRDAALKTRVGLGLARRTLTAKRLSLVGDATGFGLIAYSIGWVDGLRPALGVGIAGLFVLVIAWKGEGQ